MPLVTSSNMKPSFSRDNSPEPMNMAHDLVASAHVGKDKIGTDVYHYILKNNRRPGIVHNLSHSPNPKDPPTSNIRGHIDADNAFVATGIVTHPDH